MFSKRKKEIEKLKTRIQELSNEIKVLKQELSSKNNGKDEQIKRLSSEHEQTLIKMNKERYDIEELLAAEKNSTKFLSKYCGELKEEVLNLRKEIKKPKNYKFRYTRTETFYVKDGSFQRPADVSVVTYSIYSIAHEEKLKEFKQAEYFLERFYWNNNGYISFNPPPQIFPDGVSRPYKGTDNKTYILSFSTEFKVKPWDVSIKHISVVKRLTSKALSEAKKIFNEISGLLGQYDNYFESLQFVTEEFEVLNYEFEKLKNEYNKNIQKLDNDVKEAKKRFNSKFEKFKKG